MMFCRHSFSFSAPLLSIAFAVRAFGLAVAADSTVLFCGGAGHVGGSCALVENGDYRVLVDCGSSYGEETAKSGRVSSESGFGFDPHAISNVVITHAHQDHAGRLPSLVRSGFSGTVWMTPPTLSLLSIVWRSQIKYDAVSLEWKWSVGGRRKARTVHWREGCRWARKISEKNRRAFTGSYRDVEQHIREREESDTFVFPCSECQQQELDDILRHVRTVDFDKPVSLGPFSVVLRPVKHLPGSAAVYFADGSASWAFSGDLGTIRSQLVERIKPAEKADYLFVESTYGDNSYGDEAAAINERQRFRKTVGDAVRSGGLAWIPAFALDRSQRVLVEIQAGIDEGLVPPDAPVYYLSPSSRDIAKAYIGHPEWFDNGRISRIAGLFGRSLKEFKAKEYEGVGGILLTTSGMMDAGASYAFLPDLVPRKDVTVCLVGYQAPGTCGSRLKKGAKSLKLDDSEKVDVGCRVESFVCFSGHADAREAEAWLANNWQSKIYLVHGDRESLVKRKEGLEKRFNADVEVARGGKKYVMRRR